MAKRKMLAIIIALVISVSLCGCGRDQAEFNSQSKFGGFIVVSKAGIDTTVVQFYMYDPETMIMYTFVDGLKGGGMTVIYNTDGTPKLYSPNAK